MASQEFIGDTLRGSHDYLIQSHEIRDDCLDVFVVTRTDNTSQPYEAQAFARELPRENEGLCQARRRRMKRIFRSKNFEQEIMKGDRRFLISRVERNWKEWRDLRAQVGGGREAERGGEREGLGEGGSP